MAGRYVAPSIGARSFSCPYCGSLAHQDWFKCRAEPYGEAGPSVWNAEILEDIKRKDPNFSNNSDLVNFIDMAIRGDVFLEKGNTEYVRFDLINLNLSKCFSCGSVTLWKAQEILLPRAAFTHEPHPDMPEDVKKDYLEAGQIYNSSPRGSAALLRLGIQKLLIELGEKGENINSDIGSLVAKGLDSRVQKALDIVRVVGNNAVHPGQISWEDTPEIALKLFDLVNYIVQDRITRPREIDRLYDTNLTDGQKDGVTKRDRQ